MVILRTIFPILILFTITNGLTPIHCQYEIVNAFVERYPKHKNGSQKLFFTNKKVFEILPTELMPDSTKGTFEARITINEKSLNCKTRTKRYIFISNSCESVQVYKKQYLIPETLRNEIRKIPKKVLKELKLTSCIEMNEYQKK